MYPANYDKFALAIASQEQWFRNHQLKSKTSNNEIFITCEVLKSMIISWYKKKNSPEIFHDAISLKLAILVNKTRSITN